MRVTVRLFARLRDITGTGELTRRLPTHVSVDEASACVSPRVKIADPWTRGR